MMIKKFLLSLLICSICFSAQVIRYVDPDATGAGDGTSWTDAYVSLVAWDVGEQTNLVTDGDYHTCYCRSSGGTADTSEVGIGTGWTTDSTHYIEVIGFDFPATGVWSSSAYRLEISYSSAAHVAIAVQEDYVYLRNLQVHYIASGTASGYAVQSSYTNGHHVFDSCIYRVSDSSSEGQMYCYLGHSNGATVTHYNCIGYTDTNDHPVFGPWTGGGNEYLYNCTSYNGSVGYTRYTFGGVTVTATNCIAANATDSFSQITPTYSCSDDGDGTNAQTPSGGTWANEMMDPNNGDFRLVAGGNCVGNGTDDPGSGLYSDDIQGTARSSTWDIGAYELESTPTGLLNFMIISQGNMHEPILCLNLPTGNKRRELCNYIYTCGEFDVSGIEWTVH